MLRIAVTSLLVALLVGPDASARQAPAPDPRLNDLHNGFVASLDRIAAELDGVLGYTIVDLTTGERTERLPDAVLATASTIKLAILYEMFRQSEEGRLALDDVRVLDRRHAVGGAGILFQLTTPSMSLRDYATLMIMLSDNTATNVLIDAVGMENVTSRLAGLGLKNTKLRRRMIDTEAAQRGQENVSTPREIARLLELLHEGAGLTPASREALLDILQRPKGSALRRGVPSSVPVASKPGSLEGIQVDAGVVYVTGRPYVFSVMTGYLKQASDGEAAIEAASRAAYDYFNRLARSSEYGRVIR